MNQSNVIALSGTVALSAVEVEAAHAVPKHVELPASAVVDRAALTKAFDIVKSVVETRSTIPILSNAMLHASGDSIVVTATDLDMEIRVTVPASIDKDFRVTAPAHALQSFLKKATACDLVAFTTAPGPMLERKVAVSDLSGKTETELYTEAGTLTVEFDAVKYRLNALPCADFPIWNPGEFSHRFTMPGKVLWDMIDGTSGAMSTEETRYYLNGIYAHVIEGNPVWSDVSNSYVASNQPGQFVLVATDGHRLYRQTVEAQDGALGMPGAILPRKLVELVLKLTKGKACPAEFDIAVSATAFRVAYGNVEILSKLVDGTFPDYQRVIPSNDGIAMTFDRDAMAEAVRSVSLISSERGRAVKFIVARDGCKLVVMNPDSGSAVSTIACGWDADEFEIGVNGRYLDAVLADIGDGQVTMTFGLDYRQEDLPESERGADAGSPIRLIGPREGWDGVLMPMRV